MTYRWPIFTRDRVALAPHLDLWMAGCRFGYVTALNRYDRWFRVRLDTGLEVTLEPEDLLGAVGPRNDPAFGPSESHEKEGKEDVLDR